jgi:hypothetical protein
MQFNFKNLDDKTREMMEKELDFDLGQGKLYPSKRFNQEGKNIYPSLLREAIRAGNEQTLAMSLTPNFFETKEIRITKNGPISAQIPITANITLAEGEFNRFYMRALCILASEDSHLLKVYRAKQVSNPRIESEQMIGNNVDPKALLKDLRTNIGIDTFLGLPKGPNSGLSVELIIHPTELK